MPLKTDLGCPGLTKAVSTSAQERASLKGKSSKKNFHVISSLPGEVPELGVKSATPRDVPSSSLELAKALGYVAKEN